MRVLAVYGRSLNLNDSRRLGPNQTKRRVDECKELRVGRQPSQNIHCHRYRPHIYHFHNLFRWQLTTEQVVK